MTGAVAVSDVRLLLPAVLAWAVGAATLGLPPVGRGVVILVALLAGAGVAVAASRARRLPACSAVLLLTVAVVVLLQVAALGQGLMRDRGQISALAAQRASVSALAVVTSDPMPLTARGDEQRVLLRATLIAVTVRGRTVSTQAPVLLSGGVGLSALPWRSTVQLRGRLAPMDTADDALAAVSVAGSPTVRDPPGLLASGAERLRAGLRDALDDAPADARGLLPGLVIGDTSRTPPDLTDAMRATGMTHLTAVSGSNVAVVTGLVLGLGAILGLPRRLRPVLAGVALVGFVILARPEPSVVRAAAMGAIGLLGLSRSRRSAGMPVLAGAIVAVLVLDPWLARSYGFALSTLATLGLLLFTRSWGEAIGRRLPGRLTALGPALAVPVAAQVMTAPVIVLLQGSVSVVGVLANLLAAPLVPPATIAGVAASVMSVLWPWGASLVGWLGAVPTLGIAGVARAFAEVPGGTMPWPDGAVGAVLLAGLMALVVLGGRTVLAGVGAHPVVALGVTLLAAACLVPTRVVTWPPDGWRVVACDVGQGDAIAVRSGPGRAVLVDTGPDPGAVDGCLDRLGIQVLDAIVITHFHADHVDGLVGALRGRQVGRLLVCPVAEPDFGARDVARLAREAGVPSATVRAGDVIDLGELHAVVWSPWRRIAAGSVPNNASVVLAAHTGDVDALLLGDIEREAAHDLLLRLRRDPGMASAAAGFEVVKMPHHGSSNLDDELMTAVRAPVGIVSVGAENDYGHPSRHALDVLAGLGAATYRTDRDGDVAVVELVDGSVVVRTGR